LRTGAGSAMKTIEAPPTMPIMVMEEDSRCMCGNIAQKNTWSKSNTSPPHGCRGVRCGADAAPRRCKCFKTSAAFVCPCSRKHVLKVARARKHLAQVVRGWQARTVAMADATRTRCHASSECGVIKSSKPATSAHFPRANAAMSLNERCQNSAGPHCLINVSSTNSTPFPPPTHLHTWPYVAPTTRLVIGLIRD
jgi:hypothetical protein